MRGSARAAALAAMVAGCGNSPMVMAPDGADTTAPDLEMAPDNFIGAACQRPDDATCNDRFVEPDSQGTCAGGEICIIPSCQFLAAPRVVNYGAWRGGYCTASCAGSNGHPDSAQCPVGTLCSASDRMETQQCLLVCSADADCRVADGYSCQVDGLGAYADQHLAMPRGYTHACRPDTACTRSGDEPGAGFLNQPVPLAPGVLAAAEGNVAFDGQSTLVVTYMGYWPHDGIFDINVVAVACTLDNGGHCTWSTPTAFHYTRGMPPGVVTDPSVAFDPTTGDFYWAWLDFVDFNNSILRVSRSTDGGASWSAPADVATGVADKPWIVARGGVVWAVAVDASDALRIARSPDRGQTWAQHRLAIPAEKSFYPQPAVDESGNLFLAWQGEVPAKTPETIQTNIRVAMWPAGKPCAVLPAPEDCFVGKTAATVTTLFDADRDEDVPMASAFDPSDGSFWIAFVRGSRYVASDIFALRCVPGPNSMGCDAPLRVSQPGAAQTCGVRILPAIAFDEIGTAHVAWADNRYGAGDRGRIWYARSGDGKTFSESVLSDADHVFTVSKEWSAGWYGDYMGLTASGGRVIALWSDSRQMPPTGIQPTGFVRQRMFVGVK